MRNMTLWLKNEILVTYLWDIFWDLPLKKYSLNPVKLKPNNILNFKIDKLLAGQKWPKSFEVTKILSDFVLSDKLLNKGTYMTNQLY